MNTINVENCKTLLIGRRGENEVATVAFDFTEWASEFGSGVVDLYVKRFGDNSAYPVVLTIDGTIATWTVTATDTNVAGYGKAEYVYRVDGKIAKSAVVPFFVAEDIGQPASEPPDPYESWLEQLTALGAETEAHAQAAEQSAENAAESAEDAAQSAASAEGYAGQAETAAGLAQDAQTASEAARDAAQTAQASAESSATAASGSAASAAGSATAAAGSASDASSSASAAGASASAASASATTASNAATAAQTAQSAAEDAAEDAQQAAQQAHVDYEQLSGEVDDLSDEVSQQKSAIEDLEALTNRKAGRLIDTASGAIASFVPDATVPNLLGLSVDIEPVQDLHGYDSPWPGGGNVNLWDTTPLEGAGYNVNIGTVLDFHDGGEIAVDGNRVTYAVGVWGARNFKTRPLSAGAYTIHINLSEISNPRVSMYVVDPQNAVTDKYTTTSASIITRTMNVPDGYFILVYVGSSIAQTLTFVNYQIEAGTAFTAWSPYENLCPISGWNSVEVERTGINILDEQWESGQFNGNINTGIIGKAQDSTRIRTVNDFPVTPLTTYYVHSPQPLFAYFLDSEKVWINRVGSNGTTLAKNATFTTPENCRFIKFFTINTPTYNHDISINYPNEDHDYHPYAGNRYAIPLGQTVYGGTLDVTNGEAAPSLDAIDLGTATWEQHSTDIHIFQLTPNNLVDSSVPMLCSIFKPVIRLGQSLPSIQDNEIAVTNSAAYTIVRVRSNASNTLQDFLALCAGQTLVFKPKSDLPTIEVTPQQIPAISGQTNNVWADAGDVEVEYAADIKTYIDSKIAALAAQIVNS